MLISLKRKRIFILFLFAVLCSFNILAEPTIVKLNKNDQEHYWLNVTLNQKKAKFILDTGATGSVVDSAKLADFNLKKDGKPFSGTGFGDETSSKIQTDTLEVNQFSIEGVTTGIDSIFTHSLAQLPDGISGIVGQDVLVDLDAKLDVANSQLIIPNENSVKENELSGIQVPIQISEMGFHFISAILGGKSTHLILDTGAPQTVMDQNLVTEMGFKSTLHPKAKTIDAKGKEIPIHILTSQVLQIGKAELTPEIMLTDMSGIMKAVNQPGSPKIVGVLGNTEMANLGATIDFKTKQLLLKPAK